jgi:hypothetical protein
MKEPPDLVFRSWFKGDSEGAKTTWIKRISYTVRR